MKILREIILLVIGFAVGMAVCLYESTARYITFVPNLFKPLVMLCKKNSFLSTVPNWAYLLAILIILLVLMIVFTEFLRLFSNSKNLGRIYVLVCIVLGAAIVLPYTYFVLSRIQNNLISKSEMLYAFIFWLVFRLIGYGLGFSYGKMLRRPVRNCRVLLCDATGEGAYEFVKILAKHLTFSECYTYMRNSQSDFPKGHFYQVQERGWFGLWKIGTWNYYRDGSAVKVTDAEFLSRMYYSKNEIVNKENNNNTLKLKEENNERNSN